MAAEERATGSQHPRSDWPRAAVTHAPAPPSSGARSRPCLLLLEVKHSAKSVRTDGS